MRDGASAVTADLSETDAKGKLTKVGGTVSCASGCNFFVKLSTGKLLAAEKNYTLKVTGVPTPVDAGNVWGSVSLSAGK